jgi:signal transduction histidine kinase
MLHEAVENADLDRLDGPGGNRSEPCRFWNKPVSDTMTKHIALQELSSGKSYRISLPCLVGRSTEAELSLSDRTLSRRHALIGETNNQLWIQDLQSSNGVFINGKKINEKAFFKQGDSIQLGQLKLLVSQAEEEPLEQTVILHSLDADAECPLDHQRLELIYDITTELSDNQDLNALGERIFSRFKKIFNQDRGYIALFQEDGSLKPICMGSALRSIPLSKSILNRLFQNGESFLLADALSEDSLKEQGSVIGLRIRSALCAALIYRHQIYGLIYLDRNIPGAYQQGDLTFLKGIASILAPIIENTRLWSDLKKQYSSAMDSLRETQARLIGMERAAASGRLAQAMAHEIRNPLMVIGGLVRRTAPSELEGLKSNPFNAIMTSVERIEMALKEMDSFVSLPPPQRKLVKMDRLIQEAIEDHDLEWEKIGLRPLLSISTPQLMVPLDSDLFRKALSLIFKEILASSFQASDIKIVLQDSDNELEILIGETENRHFCELFDSEFPWKPWSLSLYLNVAHKIISDHGGKLLFVPSADSPFPIVMRMPRTIKG